MNISSRLRRLAESRAVIWLFLLIAIAYVLSFDKSSEPASEPKQTFNVVTLIGDPACNAALRRCNAMFDNVLVGLQAKAPVRVLRPFDVTINVAGLASEQIDQVRAEFIMKGMQMGQSRYAFRRLDNGLWSAAVTLPVCTSGRSDWIAMVYVYAGRTLYEAHMPLTVQ